MMFFLLIMAIFYITDMYLYNKEIEYQLSKLFVLIFDKNQKVKIWSVARRSFAVPLAQSWLNNSR